MSEAQERRRAEVWESQHKESFDARVKALQAMKARLDAMDPSSDEYTALKAQYDAEYESAQEFFVKYYESP